MTVTAGSNAVSAPKFRRRLKFDLRSSDQVLLLYIPQTGSQVIYQELSSQFQRSEFLPLDRDDAFDIVREHDVMPLQGYRLIWTEHDYTIYRHFSRKPVYITSLRDPVTRVIAAYERFLANPSHPLHHEVNARRLSLSELMSHPSAKLYFENRQIKQIVGALDGELKGLSPEVMFDLARIRLEDFAFVGVSERLAESIELLRHIFGLKNGRLEWPLTKHQLTEPSSSYDGATMKFIRDSNMLDIKLYRHALRKFDRHLDQMRYELRHPPERMYLAPMPFFPHRFFLRLGMTLRQWNGIAYVGRLRRWLIPEGSRREKGYLKWRKRIFGW